MASSKSELYRVQPREPNSLKGSSAAEIKGTAALERLLNEASPVCSDSDIISRELVIQALQEALEDWIAAVAVEKGLYPDKKSAKASGGTIYISGSFRLGVSGPSDDIDAICVTPRFVTRDDFFQGFTARLERVPGITKVRPIASAAVPLTEVELDGIEVDLLFCRLNRASIHPSKLDILDDLVLKGADIASVRSINGPRVTELLATLVPDKARYRLVLRATRLWCKRRGLYSNKMGFLGGVNLGIVAAYFCQRFPAMEPAGILFRFFVYLARWNWPDPVFITTPYQRVDMSLEVPVWDPARNPQHARHRMPIITPAYPCDTSTYNVLSSTLAVMRREFRVRRQMRNQSHTFFLAAQLRTITIYFVCCLLRMPCREA
jgi:poly(A) polymerase